MTEASRCLPDFIGIGALKAGTTSLDALLRTHPAICMPSGMKEVQYFTRYYERGADWYAAQFDCQREAVRGEISPQYLVDPQVPRRIAELLPDARLVLSVREPIERTYSQYKHFVRETGYRDDFETYLVDHPTAIERSNYWTMLQRYLDHFPSDNVFVIVFEDTVATGADLSPLFRFLGISDQHVPALADDHLNVSARPRMPWLYARSKSVSRWLYDRGYGSVVTSVKQSPAMALFSSGRRGNDFAVPTEATIERLVDLYSDEVAGLSSFVERALSPVWPRFAHVDASGVPAR